ncbi:MAG TPA: acyltransferase [Methylophilaceae bacterium]|jgi:peptidoglycan/LPS O-acetylase OafA/YrhL
MAEEHFKVLDGWRGISILTVLACHLLPLSPKAWHFNATAGLLGMSLFFTLSGFLITHFLLHKPGVMDFLIRRFFRILPLAWLYIAVSLWLYSADVQVWLAHLLFYANYTPLMIPKVTDHLWSLCVEMHFYVGIALLISLFRQRGLLLLPVLLVVVTLFSIYAGVHASILTHFRVGEILSGATLALIYERRRLSVMADIIGNLHPLLIAGMLLLSCHPAGGFLMYLRPYFAALLVGITLLGPAHGLSKLLEHRVLAYIAAISYALYVIHPLLASSFLGSGDTLQKYLKRPLLFVVLFTLAHVSTFYYEKHWIALGKRLSLSWNRRLCLEPG